MKGPVSSSKTIALTNTKNVLKCTNAKGVVAKYKHRGWNAGSPRRSRKKAFDTI